MYRNEYVPVSKTVTCVYMVKKRLVVQETPPVASRAPALGRRRLWRCLAKWSLWREVDGKRHAISKGPCAFFTHAQPQKQDYISGWGMPRSAFSMSESAILWLLSPSLTLETPSVNKINVNK